MRKHRKMIITVCVIAALVTAAAIYGFWENTALECNTLTVTEKELPAEFDGLRIAHISDLHSAQFGSNNRKLLQMLRQCQPDLICITGDLMDQRDDSAAVALEFAAEAVKIAPCYYVTGNHEARLEHQLYAALTEGLEACGVTVLDDREILVTRVGASIAIAGHFWGDTERAGALSKFDGYRILLSHQPEDLENYAAGGYDLVLCGHAHGGQFRIPGLGGLIAPGQGLFPKYDSGLYSMGKTDMIVSRGLGNSSFPFRLNNPPEIVLVVLRVDDT